VDDQRRAEEDGVRLRANDHTARMGAMLDQVADTLAGGAAGA